ncbi:MAG TPA: fumarylacetoacetate hydrolase, partial [Novosphingobium sp.]|nr:fumarylacetoacetate hydrolase [Novosphingobium sp.]
MRLATLRDGSPDGALAVISADGARYLAAPGLSLLAAIGDWGRAEPVLQRLAAGVAAGQGGRLDPARLQAPLPRTWQWLDGSAFLQHGKLMQVAFHLPP